MNVPTSTNERFVELEQEGSSGEDVTPLDLVASALSLEQTFSRPLDLPAMRKNVTKARESLDNFGVDTVEQILSTGVLPVEFALHNKIPPLVFLDWVADNFTVSRLERIKATASEALVVRAKHALTTDADTSQQASLRKAYSELMMKLAERMTPENWAPPKAADPPPPPVTIQIQGNIPGLEALSRPSSQESSRVIIDQTKTRNQE